MLPDPIEIEDVRFLQQCVFQSTVSSLFGTLRNSNYPNTVDLRRR